MMNRMLLLFLISALTLVYPASAQQRTADQAGRQRPFVLGVVDRINSAELGEPRLLNVYLPEGYSGNDTARYPVIFLLDGSANEDFVHVTGIVQFLTMIGQMPPTIVIGIANVDRKRDFTFPSTNEADRKLVPTSGGSARFLSFLEKELRPFIDGKYRTGGRTILIGQSLGGLLASEVLLKRPWLFSDYIIISPSLWWDGESLLDGAPKLLKGATFRDSARVYVGVGKEGAQMENVAKRLVERLEDAGRKTLRTQLVPFPEEDHLTILHNSVYRILTMMYPLPVAEQQ